MNCRTVRNLTSAYLEDEVTAEEREGIDEHLQICSRCSVSLFHTSRVVSLAAGLPRVSVSRGFTDQVLARVADLDAESRAASRAVAPRASVLSLARWRALPALRLPAAVWAPSLAAAAVVLAFTGLHGVFVPHSGPSAGHQMTAGVVRTAHEAGVTPIQTAAPADRGATVAQAPISRASGNATQTAHRLAHETPATVAALTPRTRASARRAAADNNPFASVSAVGPDGVALQGHDLLEPSTQVDLIYEQVSPERAGLVQRAGTTVPGGTTPKRRYWTF